MPPVVLSRRPGPAQRQLEQLTGLDGVGFEIGDPTAQYRQPSGRFGVKVLTLIAWHEYGIGVPQRPMIRPVVAANRGELLRRLQASAKRTASGEPSEAALTKVGAWLADRIVEHLEAGIAPPLSRATLSSPDPRISEHPLLKTGQIRKVLRSVRARRR